MALPECETDVVRLIHHNDSGHHLVVKPDDDGLGIVEIDGKEEFGGRLLLSPGMARQVALAMVACANELDAKP